MKKIIALILMVTILFAMGCGKSANETNKPKDTNKAETPKASGETPAANGKATDIEFWTFQDLHVKYYETMAEKWNAANPDKQINLIPTVYPFEDMHSKLLMALQSGKGAPDLVDIEAGKYANFLKGETQLLPLNDIVEPELNNIVKARVDIYSKDNNYYGICFHVGAAVIYYNTELCEKAGIDWKNIKTWDDYYEAGKKLKAAEPDKYWESVEATDVWHMWPMLAELGADMTTKDSTITINTPEMKKVLEYNRKLIDEGLAVVAPGGYHHAEEFYAMMNEGKIGSIVMPMWYLDRFTNYMPDLKKKVGIAPLPVWEAGQKRSIGQGGTGTSITNQAENPELIKEFLSFAKLSQEAGKEIWNTLGFDPIRTDVWSMKEVTHASNVFTDYFVDNPFDTLLEIKDEIVASNNGENLPQALDVMKNKVLPRAYEESDIDIGAMLKEEQDAAIQ